jgi:hypothetical protein
MNQKSFKELVSGLPEISDCYREGLKALGSNAGVVKVRSTRDFNGSVDMDQCSSIPNTTTFPKRWDYLFDYQAHVLALEVHPAHGDNSIKEVIEKAEWLKNWLKTNASVLKVEGFYFVATGPVSYSNSTLKSRLAQKGILFCGKILDIEKERKFWRKSH